MVMGLNSQQVVDIVARKETKIAIQLPIITIILLLHINVLKLIKFSDDNLI